MSIRSQLDSDLKDAMRARDSVRLATIRSLRSALQKRDIDARVSGSELSDADVLQVLQKEAKQRRESIEQFEAAGRDDLVTNEQRELEIIEQYLPEQMADDAVKERLRQIVAQVGATSMADIGKVMGPAMSQLRGSADGKRVQAIVRELLAGSSPE